MWKWFKRLIVLVIVVFFAVAALLIPDKIDSQDQLKNVSTQTSLADLAQAGIGGASLSSGGVSTEINLDSNQFRQILKASMADSNDETLQNSSVELNDSYLTAKVPVSLGPIGSTFSLDFTVSTNKEVILLDLASADGVQLYFDKNGKQVKGSLVDIDGKTYYFDKDSGAMWTNTTLEKDGKTYIIDENGVATEKVN